MKYVNDYMLEVSQNYMDFLGEPLDDDRLNELDLLLLDCASLEDLEALADCEDATISFGEFESILPIATKVFGLKYEEES